MKCNVNFSICSFCIFAAVKTCNMKIKIVHLKGEDNRYDGRTGTVTLIDGIGQLHGTWGSLAVIPGVDEYEIIEEKGEPDEVDE